MPDGQVMNEPITYKIVLRGQTSGRLLARLRDDFSIDAAGRQTRLVGEIRDAAQLHGVLTQLTSYGIEILRLGPLEPEVPQPINPSERQS